MSVRFQIAAIISVVVNAVLFGVGAIIVLSIPALADSAKILLPIVVVLSFLMAPIASWIIAPRLRVRYWKTRTHAAQ